MKSAQLEAGVCGNWNRVLSSETVSQRKNSGRMFCPEDSPQRLFSLLLLAPVTGDTRSETLDL